MRDSKRAIIATVSVVLAVIAVSAAVLLSPFSWHDDLKVRRELAGSIDMLFAGASQCHDAFYTNVIDEALGTNSYNLGIDALSPWQKTYLLKNELDRNDLDTVVLEIAYDAMEKKFISEFVDENVYCIARLETLEDRLDYYFNCIRYENKGYVYSQLMLRSLVSTAENVISGSSSSEKNARELKGSYLTAAKDHTLPDDEIVEKFGIKPFSTDNYLEETVSAFEEMIDICLKKNIRVIVAVVPVSDNFIWEYSGLDDFDSWVKTRFCKNGVEFYDFNLMKNRFEVLSDKDCYGTDSHHMSGTGAAAFSKEFARIIKEAADGTDVSPMFYKSYEEMMNDCPYMEYYKAHK
ncbi:MAG: hypothetical protein IJS45_01580 [Clostridia bacterium]|nr:hypothetical protein [Clostridia bacterium]